MLTGGLERMMTADATENPGRPYESLTRPQMRVLLDRRAPAVPHVDR